MKLPQVKIEGLKRYTSVPLTPERAKKFLAMAAPNRTIKKAHLKYLESQIRLGLWVYNGAPIVFDKNGQMIDGQHRCLAVINTGITIHSDVLIGMESEALLTYNTGKANSIRDQRAILGQKHNHGTTATVRMAAELLADERIMLNDYQVEDMWRELVGDASDLMEGIFTKASLMGRGDIKGSFAFAWLKDPDAVTKFAKAVATGEASDGVAMKAGTAAYTLRKYLLRNVKPGRAGSSARKEIASKVLRAIRAHLEGQKLSTLTSKAGTLEYFCEAYDQSDVDLLLGRGEA